MAKDATVRHETTFYLVWFTGLLEPRITAQILKVDGDGFDTTPFLLKEWQSFCARWDCHYIVEAQSGEDAIDIVRNSRHVDVRLIDGVKVAIRVRKHVEVAA